MRNPIKILGQTILVIDAVLFLVWFFGKDLVEKEFAVSFEPGLGRDIFRIITGQKGPQFTLVAIEPKDVKPGDVQKLSVKIEDPSGVTAVTAETELDKSTFSLPLKLREGDDKSGAWTNIWFVNDTHSKTYRTKFIARNSKGETSHITLAWSDTCTAPLNGDWTVSANCTITSVVGADNGNISLGGTYTLTINAGGVLVYNSGNSISLSTGSIALNTTDTQIAQANIFITDADSDSYAPSSYSTTYSTASSLSGYVRRYAALSTSDCNDGDATRWRNRYTDSDGDGYCPNSSQTCVGNQSGYGDSCTTYTDCDDGSSAKYQTLTCYLDSDGDSYTVSNGTSVCKGSSCATPADSYKALSSPADCYDSNANAKPGQTAYYTSNRGDGLFDYNCSGATEYYYPTVGNENTCGDGSANNNLACGIYNAGVTAGWRTSLNTTCGGAATWLTGACPYGCVRGSDRSTNPTYGYSPTTSSQIQQCH